MWELHTENDSWSPIFESYVDIELSSHFSMRDCVGIFQWLDWKWLELPTQIHFQLFFMFDSLDNKPMYCLQPIVNSRKYEYPLFHHLPDFQSSQDQNLGPGSRNEPGPPTHLQWVNERDKLVLGGDRRSGFILCGRKDKEVQWAPPHVYLQGSWHEVCI